MDKQSQQGSQLSEDERTRVDRFIAAYNRIDRHLRDTLKRPMSFPNKELIQEFEDRTPGWGDGDTLKEYAKLRNWLVHEMKRSDGVYLAGPAEFVVADMEAICERLIRPERVLPKFGHPVTVLESTDSLEKAFWYVHECAYSQFPIYRGPNYRGLLTENGMTRWLAHNVKRLSSIALADIPVGQVINEEEARGNCVFLPGAATVVHAVGQFLSLPQLEAVLITEDGKHSPDLLGIITRWDIAQILRQQKRP